MILKPLQKIRIIDSNKMCKAESLGYFVAQEAMGRYNAWNMSILFTRFGKAGKPRLYPLAVNSLMINYNDLNKTNKTILNIIKFYDVLEPRHNSHREIEVGATLLEPIPMEHKNLLDLSDNEFTAYVVALSLFICKLTKRTSIISLHRIPALTFGNFAVDGFDFAAVSPEYVGYYILYGLRLADDERKLGLVGGRGKLFDASYAERIGSRAGRKELLFKLHMSLAMSKNAFMSYNRRIFGCFNNIDTKINDLLKYYRRNGKELDCIKRDEERYIKDLANAPHNKGRKMIPRKGRMKIRRA